MNYENKLNIIFISLFILLPVVYTSLSSPITATDWIYRHTLWIKSYLDGSLQALSEYPPLFHLMMLPFVALQMPMQIFQVIFSVLNVLVIFWFLKTEHGDDAVVYAGLFLASSIMYMQVSSALMPQALDLVFFLPALHFYNTKKFKYTIALLIFLFLLHTTSLIYAFILFVYSLTQKQYKFALIMVLLVLAFSPLYYGYFFNDNYKIIGEFVWNSKAQIEWEKWFYDPWWHFFATSGILAWFYLPSAINVLRKRNFYISEKQKLYLLWLLCFVPMLFGFNYPPLSITLQVGEIWRGMTFLIVPFYFLVATIYSEKNNLSYMSSMKSDKNDYKKRFKKIFGEKKYKVAS